MPRREVLGILLLAAVLSGQNRQEVLKENRIGLTTGRPIVASRRMDLTAEITPVSGIPGKPIFLKLKTKNISSKEMLLSNTIWYWNYEVKVLDSRGREPSRTELGLRALTLNSERTLLRNAIEVMKPGQDLSEEIELTQIYQTFSPGTYAAQVSRYAWPNEGLTEPGEEQAVSNVVSFTVVAE